MVSSVRVRAYGVGLLLFVLGAVAGAAAAYAMAVRSQRELTAGGMEAFERRKVRALTRRLDLSDEQTARVRAIVREDREARRKLTQDVFERCGTSLHDHREKTDQRIRAVLNPEQRQHYEELLRERRDPFRGPRRRGGPQGPGRERGGPPGP